MGQGPDTFWGEIAVSAVLGWPFTLVVLLAVVAIVLVMLVSTFLGLGITFQKAGYSSWKSIVPFYNLYILTRIGELKSWYATGIVVQILAFLSALILKYAGVMKFESVTNLSSGNQIIKIYSVPTIAAEVLAVSIGIMMLYLFYSVARRFRKSIGYAFGLLLFPFIFWPMLGMSSADYQQTTEKNI